MPRGESVAERVARIEENIRHLEKILDELKAQTKDFQKDGKTYTDNQIDKWIKVYGGLLLLFLL